MLHSLVAPVIILAASTCTASSCFFVSVEQFSHTESEYSRTGRIKDMYMRSRAVRFILNFKLLIRFNLAQALLVMFGYDETMCKIWRM